MTNHLGRYFEKDNLDSPSLINRSESAFMSMLNKTKQKCRFMLCRNNYSSFCSSSSCLLKYVENLSFPMADSMAHYNISLNDSFNVEKIIYSFFLAINKLPAEGTSFISAEQKESLNYLINPIKFVSKY